MEQVTQADRSFFIRNRMLSLVEQGRVETGEMDCDQFMQEIARHRIEATRTTDQAKDEEIARYREALDQLLDAYITTCLFDGGARFEIEEHNAVRLARQALGASNA